MVVVMRHGQSSIRRNQWKNHTPNQIHNKPTTSNWWCNPIKSSMCNQRAKNKYWRANKTSTRFLSASTEWRARFGCVLIKIQKKSFCARGELLQMERDGNKDNYLWFVFTSPIIVEGFGAERNETVPWWGNRMRPIEPDSSTNFLMKMWLIGIAKLIEFMQIT